MTATFTLMLLCALGLTSLGTIQLVAANIIDPAIMETTQPIAVLLSADSRIPESRP
jgi:hypothetical protein